jgi:hypothetical protein
MSELQVLNETHTTWHAAGTHLSNSSTENNKLKVNHNHDMFRSDQIIIQWTEVNTKGYKLHSYYHTNTYASQYIYIYKVM